MTRDFSLVTEAPGQGATQEQLQRLYQRYHLAREVGSHRRVLEVGCGAGLGLGYIRDGAKGVVGGDLTLRILLGARGHYGSSIPLACFDAQFLPFSEGSFDVIVLFEAIYYIPDAGRFALECKRILGPQGQVVVSSVNPEWAGFSPSQGSSRYLSATEMRGLFAGIGFRTVLFGGFPVEGAPALRKGVESIRALATALHLVPQTLKGRAMLKRLFYGKTEPLEAEVRDGMAVLQDLTPLRGAAGDPVCKIIYVVGTLP